MLSYYLCRQDMFVFKNLETRRLLTLTSGGHARPKPFLTSPADAARQHVPLRAGIADGAA